VDGAARVRLSNIDVCGTPRAGVSLTLGNLSQVTVSDVRVANAGGPGLIAPDPNAVILQGATLDVCGLHVYNSSGPAVTAIALPSVSLTDVDARNTSLGSTALGRVVWLERLGWCAVRGITIETATNVHIGFYSVARGVLSDVAWYSLGAVAANVTVQRVDADGVIVTSSGMLAPAAPLLPKEIVADASVLAKDLQAVVQTLISAGIWQARGVNVSALAESALAL
jgi:hypothetical protein